MVHFGSIQYYFLFLLGIDQMSPFCFPYLGTFLLNVNVFWETCACGSKSILLIFIKKIKNKIHYTYTKYIYIYAISSKFRVQTILGFSSFSESHFCMSFSLTPPLLSHSLSLSTKQRRKVEKKERWGAKVPKRQTKPPFTYPYKC